ncbi:isocitrate dehydrogenase [NAD] subunit gamma, mitochondrial-like [Oncorhynchus nerka]|uniref:Isocitrate dehydrogenase [NAD] subunit, mitochondrial n=1 Tax=Oncorhynchus kisutch TaxID=8019 RepID=A0A8C7N2S3_ONCKI|nr:isocitrate dehydrogenase [NAD] subunit gamma, mitochondrial-like isoform X2 [Oncorhynchus kisutch]XP_029510963.1 isocitrate dehydrogenase [NAD] subunit gamma, mitochondrial-like isoform X2 [Oncorhynchus nerka]XP_055747430.1 isocitrate dehydrogenase [NAD] subunit gamma, mitochondrial-like isoform X2 [Salvelinus fontinalis]
MAASSAVISMSKIIKPIWGGRLATTAKVFGATVSSRREKSTVPPPAKYGGRHTVTLIPGDGIGPELLNHVKELFRFSCVPVDFEVVNVSSATEDDINNAITAIRRNGVALKGNIETLHTLPASHKSRNNLLRTSLDLYANVMHCKSLPGVQTRHNNIDIMIIRENTEGEYSSLEHESVSGVVECLKIITRTNSLRIAEYAFKLAREKGRKRVTAVHKANIMKLGDGLFLQCCREVAAGYPDIAFDAMIVDNTTMQLVSKPQQFDVMVMPNLYGNVVSNVCAGLVGGPGLVPGANYGRDYAVFETATRNTGKSIADRNIANPTAMLLASCMMLDHLKLHDYATMIRNAVLTTMNETRLHTADIGGQGTTSEVVQAIMRNIQSKGPLTSEL